MVSACGMQGDLYLPDDNPEDSANKTRATLINYHKFCGLLSVQIQGMVRNECLLPS